MSSAVTPEPVAAVTHTNVEISDGSTWSAVPALNVNGKEHHRLPAGG